MKILIIGGAGFIGTHLTRALLAEGHHVRILDSFVPQVHGSRGALAVDVARDVELIRGDAADKKLVQLALRGIECVVQFAAETGTGQSMYEVCRYQQSNVGGAAALYEVLAKTPQLRVERIIVASSRAIYGEGAYRCDKDGVVYPPSRTSDEKRSGKFDPACPACGFECRTIPTPEIAPLLPSSYYGLTKQMQEQTAILFGRALGISTFALRYQNVYGPGQSLQNPYTGILAIFSNLARTGKNICVFEDGAESRDFVHVSDVVRATKACIFTSVSGRHTLNVGSCERTTVLDVANLVNQYCGGRSIVEVSGAFREGDIRHGMADLSQIRQLVGYEPQWRFAEGLRTFLDWATESKPETSGYEQSLAEMKDRGLLHLPS